MSTGYETERITTLHPQGKHGVKLSAAKYRLMRKAIVSALRQGGPQTWSGLAERVEHDLADRFTGSVRWHYTTVKLDLEARGEITCDRSGKQMVISLP